MEGVCGQLWGWSMRGLPLGKSFRVSASGLEVSVEAVGTQAPDHSLMLSLSSLFCMFCMTQDSGKALVWGGNCRLPGTGCYCTGMLLPEHLVSFSPLTHTPCPNPPRRNHLISSPSFTYLCCFSVTSTQVLFRALKKLLVCT